MCSVPRDTEERLCDVLLFGNYKMLEIVTVNGLKKEALEARYFSPPVKCQ